MNSEQRELARQQLDLVARAPHPARQQIHLEIADAELGRRTGPARPPQQRLEPRQKLGERERLHQIVVAAGAQALDAIVDRAQCAQDEGRGPHLGRAQGGDHGEPVHARQHAVDDERVIAAVGRHEETVAPFRGVIDDIAAFAKSFDDIGGGFAVVLDDENFHKTLTAPDLRARIGHVKVPTARNGAKAIAR